MQRNNEKRIFPYIIAAVTACLAIFTPIYFGLIKKDKSLTNNNDKSKAPDNTKRSYVKCNEETLAKHIPKSGKLFPYITSFMYNNLCKKNELVDERLIKYTALASGGELAAMNLINGNDKFYKQSRLLANRWKNEFKRFPSMKVADAKRNLKKAIKVPEGYVTWGTQDSVLITGGVSSCVAIAGITEDSKIFMAHLDAENIQYMDQGMLQKRDDLLPELSDFLKQNPKKIVMISGSFANLRYLKNFIDDSMVSNKQDIHCIWEQSWRQPFNSKAGLIIKDGEIMQIATSDIIFNSQFPSLPPCGKDQACRTRKLK